MCHLDSGKKTRTLGDEIRECRQVYEETGWQRRSWIVREIKKIRLECKEMRCKVKRDCESEGKGACRVVRNVFPFLRLRTGSDGNR